MITKQNLPKYQIPHTTAPEHIDEDLRYSPRLHCKTKILLQVKSVMKLQKGEDNFHSICLYECVVLAHGLTGALYLNLKKIQISKL
jgi:hypothetical protein